MNEFEVLKQTSAEAIYRKKIATLMNGILCSLIMLDADKKRLAEAETILSALTSTCFEYGMYSQEREEKKSKWSS